MRRLSRPPRIAALCVRGDVTTSLRGNTERIAFLADLVRTLYELPAWHPIDALVLPGGFFHMRRAFGATDFLQRRTAVQREHFAVAICSAVGLVDELSPGFRLVTGVLAPTGVESERTEQTSLAFDSTGLVAAARKLFPTPRDTLGRRFISPYVLDYTSRQRFMQLANGGTTLLSACYDLYGVGDTGAPTSTRRLAIRRLLDVNGHYVSEGDQNFDWLRRGCLMAWTKLISTQQPDVALVTIHRFRSPNLSSYWQRHGIGRASASLGGALVVGAAHFQAALPQPNTATLAACGVGPANLRAGLARRAHALLPIASHMVGGVGEQQAILRLFTSAASQGGT